MEHTPTVRAGKLAAGIICLALALLLPGWLAVEFMSGFGFGHSLEYPYRAFQDWCLALSFALCALGLAGAGRFLIRERRSPISPRAKVLIAIGVITGVAPALTMATHMGAHIVDDAEDRRRWQRETDAENEKAGFFKDTNGALIYVGAAKQPVELPLVYHNSECDFAFFLPASWRGYSVVVQQWSGEG